VSDPAGFTRYQTEVARELARYPDIPLGHSNPERWSRIQQTLIEIGEISRPADLEAFLYNPGAPARNHGDWQAAVAVVAAALLAGAGFLWRREQGRGAALRPRFAGLIATASDTLDRLKMRRGGLRPQLARLRAAVSAVPSRLASVARRSLASSGSSDPGPRPSDLNVMLVMLDRSIRRRVPDSVKSRFSLLPEPWLCYIDPKAVAATTRDLVAAAVADMPAGGDLIVGTRQYAIDDAGAAELDCGAPGDYVRLTVKDNGMGLSPERLDRIFDPAATVRPAVAAAEELVRRLGGFARVESAEGIGTAVHLYFRRAIAGGLKAQQPPEDEEHASVAAA
jgi:signal transduction histidine kinase